MNKNYYCNLCNQKLFEQFTPSGVKYLLCPNMEEHLENKEQFYPIERNNENE